MKCHTGFRRYHVFAAGLLLMQLAGCYRWEAVSIGPAGTIEGEPTHVRITEIDTGQSRELPQPQIRNDSIFASGLPEGIPLSLIRRIEARTFDGSRTFRNVLVTAIPVVVAMIGLSNSMDDFDLGRAWRD